MGANQADDANGDENDEDEIDAIPVFDWFEPNNEQPRIPNFRARPKSIDRHWKYG